MSLNLEAALINLRDQPQKGAGWGYPPDAGDSTLGAWGIQNPMVLWLMRIAPELLEWTPTELIDGVVKHPSCPNPKCGGPMALRVADASGRLPRRLVWACHNPILGSRYGGHTDCGGRRELTLHKLTQNGGAKLTELLAWTKEGATVEYQPDDLGQKRAVKT